MNQLCCNSNIMRYITCRKRPIEIHPKIILSHFNAFQQLKIWGCCLVPKFRISVKASGPFTRTRLQPQSRGKLAEKRRFFVFFTQVFLLRLLWHIIRHKGHQPGEVIKFCGVWCCDIHDILIYCLLCSCLAVMSVTAPRSDWTSSEGKWLPSAEARSMPRSPSCPGYIAWWLCSWSWNCKMVTTK
jgi:hypothetical protein